jgi:hypothetical protein
MLKIQKTKWRCRKDESHKQKIVAEKMPVTIEKLDPDNTLLTLTTTTQQSAREMQQSYTSRVMSEQPFYEAAFPY